MKKQQLFFVSLLMLISISTFAQTPYSDLSMTLIDAARNDKPYDDLLEKLVNVNEDVLAKELKTDDQKKAFWMNIYNAHIQFFLKKNPDFYKGRNAFFHDEMITVAGKKLSFDDIEHGIIRRSKSKLSLGFLPSLRVDAYEKKFRTKKVDGRVHFALNCGAKSCPAVAAYDYKKLDEQMDASTKIHLQGTTTYDKETNTANITRLFSWFRGDFGNKKKVIKFLKKYEAIPNDITPSINYNVYDWTLWIDNYIDL